MDIEWDEDVYLPCYRKINESDSDVKLLWGGRDSGKSYNVALRLVEKCLTAKKFKCILIRKTFESIRDSQFELIKSIVFDYGLSDLFSFTKAPLEIKCINGNKFIARGCDNPHNIKSVTEPTDAWYEEADKVTYSEYTTVSTTLRSSDVKVQEWISFNPECETGYEDHWLYKLVRHNYNTDYQFEKKIDVNGIDIEVKYHSCHTTFNDNPYCPPERKAKYIATTEGDDYQYNVFIRGHWGNQEVKRPFARQYNESVHVGKTKFNPIAHARVLIDFNIDPFSCSIFNAWYDNHPHCHQVEEIAVYNGTIQEMAERIKDVLGDGIYTADYSGDYMGYHGKIGRQDNQSLFNDLADELGVSRSQFIKRPNPPHKKSGNDCNYFLKNFPDFKIGEHCKNTRRDMRTVQVDAYGHIVKRNRKDESQLADFLDNFRYLVNCFYIEDIEYHKRTGQWI
jgi:PBSX family phage terminase large subunit